MSHRQIIATKLEPDFTRIESPRPDAMPRRSINAYSGESVEAAVKGNVFRILWDQ
jgi:hypothetical protein